MTDQLQLPLTIRSIRGLDVGHTAWALMWRDIGSNVWSGRKELQGAGVMRVIEIRSEDEIVCELLRVAPSWLEPYIGQQFTRTRATLFACRSKEEHAAFGALWTKLTSQRRT